MHYYYFRRSGLRLEAICDDKIQANSAILSHYFPKFSAARQPSRICLFLSSPRLATVPVPSNSIPPRQGRQRKHEHIFIAVQKQLKHLKSVNAKSRRICAGIWPRYGKHIMWLSTLSAQTWKRLMQSLCLGYKLP